MEIIKIISETKKKLKQKPVKNGFKRVEAIVKTDGGFLLNI